MSAPLGSFRVDGSGPRGDVAFEDVRASLPATERIAVSGQVALETLQVPGPAPTIVFVHGGLGSLWNPYPQLDAFAGETGLVSYALAGNGDSTDRPEHTLDGHVSDLAALLDELGVDDPIVHGHSYGTTVAIEYAQRHPVSGLVLAGGGAYDLTAAFERPLLAAVLALRLYRLPLPAWLTRRAMAAAVGPDTPDHVVADAAASNPLPRRRSAYEAPRAFRGYDGRGDLDRIDAPALVVHGSADEVVPPEVGRSTAEQLTRGVFAPIPDAGHLPMVERPAAHNGLLSALVETVRTGTDLAQTVERYAAQTGGTR